MNSDSSNLLLIRKRLGRMRRGKRLGIIVPIEGGESACKNKSKADKH